MHKNIIALGIGCAIFLQASNASALSCLPIDMYLDTVIGEETTQIFIGTATTAKNHTQVVTVTKALQGWVAPAVWVEHPYSDDWKYFCSNGPATAGNPTIFFSTVNEYGTVTVVQTLDADGPEGKAFLKEIAAAEVEAGITDAKPSDRAEEMRQSIERLIKALQGVVAEWRYWMIEARK